MGTDKKSTLNLILKIVASVLAIIALIIGGGYVANHYQFNIGSTVINNIFQGGDNSQTNPPAAATVPPTAPNPTQQSTTTAPNSNTNDDSGGSTPTSTPTPTPTSTPAPTTKLSFGEPVSGTITPDIRSNRYSIVVPQAGRLTLNVTKGSPIAPSYLEMRLMNSNDETIKFNQNVFSTGNKQSTTNIDLEAGAYYIQLKEHSLPAYAASPSLSNGAYILTVTFVPF
jgi:hypothetical protein